MLGNNPRLQLIVSLALASVGLTLFFYDVGESGPFSALGSVPFVGVWLFAIATWLIVDAVHRVPRSEAEAEIAPGEWQCWVDLGFTTAILVALVQKAPMFLPDAPIGSNPDARGAGSAVGAMLIAWVILSSVLASRWRGKVVEDERDAAIARTAARWGRASSSIAIIILALLLGFSPTERLQDFSFPLLAHILIILLVFGVWVDHVVSAIAYWRDRSMHS